MTDFLLLFSCAGLIVSALYLLPVMAGDYLRNSLYSSPEEFGVPLMEPTETVTPEGHGLVWRVAMVVLVGSGANLLLQAAFVLLPGSV